MKTPINFTNWYEDEKIMKEYIKNSPKVKKINWFDLPENFHLLLNS
jgi:hypothetical protein